MTLNKKCPVACVRQKSFTTRLFIFGFLAYSRIALKHLLRQAGIVSQLTQSNRRKFFVRSVGNDMRM